MNFSRMLLYSVPRWSSASIVNLHKTLIQACARIRPLLAIKLRHPVLKPTLITMVSAPWRTMFRPDPEEQRMLQQADKLFDENKYDELASLLKSVSSWYDNSEILWRVARCQYHQIKTMKDLDDKELKRLLENSLLLVQRSLSLNKYSGFAHKWAAIILDAYATNEGTRTRIAQAVNVRKHIENAITYAPDDATSYYLLGEWHYACSTVSWLERSIASVLYGKVPKSSMETALEMFELAEQTEPGFYSKNLIMLVKSMIALKRKPEKIADYLQKIKEKYKNSEKWDDQETYRDAKKLFKKYGIADD